MEARYNIYFAGQLLEGQTLAGVRAGLGRLFNADEATLDKLFSGKSQLVKRDCDKATALKYKQAMEQVGALPVIKASAATADAAATSAKPATAKTAGQTMTAAERIAALAAAPDLAHPQKPASTPAPPAALAKPEPADGNIQLAPAGTAVLLPEERQAPAASNVNSPDLDVLDRGQRLSDTPPASPPPPDTSHLSAGAAGELLPTLPSKLTPLSPDTSAIALSPDGADLSDCAAPAAASPVVDLSGIELAPAGADVLEQQYRKRHDQPPPATDHLTLDG